ncbi:MAG: hypothetical protein WA001_02495 [Patescibacteria group bacterium]
MALLKAKNGRWVAIGAVFLFVVITAASLTTRAIWTFLSVPSRSGLYGVFLTNGQVYFGNITKEDDRNLMLTNIYYIQTDQASSTDSGVSLLKLGNEVQGPQDYMEINRDQVLFIEQLKNDGKVAQAIQAYQQK